MDRVIPGLEAPKIRIALDQPEYLPLVAAMVRHPDYPSRAMQPGPDLPAVLVNTLLLAFKPTEEELAQLNAGAEVYLGLLTFGSPMQPVLLLVGKERAAEVYQEQVSP